MIFASCNGIKMQRKNYVIWMEEVMERLINKPVVVEGFLTVGSRNEKKIHLKIYKNEIWGIVSANNDIKDLILDGYKKGKLVRNSNKLRCIEDDIISVGPNTLENLKKRYPNCSEDTLSGMIELINLDNQNITTMTEFEKRKLKMVDAYLADADILVLQNLYDNVNSVEKEELDAYLEDFSTCRTMILTATDDHDIIEICDKIIEIIEL